MVKMDSGDWLNTAQAADVLGVTSIRVRQLIAEGRLKPTRVGSVYLLLRADVEAFAKKPRAPGRPAKPAPKKPAAKRKGK